MILGKYNQAKTITFDLFEIDGIDLSVAATFAAGDVKIMKDEGAEANTTNLPTDEGSSYSLVLTATEMSASRIRIILIDQTATKVWLDTTIGLETYGNASAEHAFDLDTASTAQTGDTYALANGATGFAAIDTVVDGIQTDLSNATDGLGAIKGDTANILIDTGTTLEAHLTDIKGGTFSGATDSLEAIRDRGDAAWITGAGGTPPQLLQNTTIATLATQVSFTLTAGSADNDAYNNAAIIITDSVTSTQKAVALVSDYVGATKTITLSADPAVFTMAAGDTVDILANIGSAPTVTQIRTEIDTNSTQLADIVADTNELQTDWADGGRLDLIQDIIAADTTTDIPALIATAQADLDTITGADGAALASTQQSITFQPITITAGDATANITFAGTGTEDGLKWTRAGSGDPFDANFIGQINATVDTALTDYDAATGTELAATEAKIDVIDGIVDNILLDTNELQADDYPTSIAAVQTAVDGIQTDLSNATDGLGALKALIDAVNTVITSTGAVLTVAERNAIADSMLDRDMSTGADSGSPTVRTVRQALRASRNKVSISGGTMTVTKEDDVTSSWSATVATTAGDPISSIDPA